MQTRPDFRILGVLLMAASVLHRRKHTIGLPLRDGVSVFMKSLNNHQHQEAVIGSKAETLTQVVVCLRCKLPVIAFFIGGFSMSQGGKAYIEGEHVGYFRKCDVCQKESWGDLWQPTGTEDVEICRYCIAEALAEHSRLYPFKRHPTDKIEYRHVVDKDHILITVAHGRKPRRSTIKKSVREKVLKPGKCKKCGSVDDLQVDHITPVKAGGGDNIENLQPLCGNCNRVKGAKIED